MSGEVNYDALWEEINRLAKNVPGMQQPHERTVRELARSWHVSEKRAVELIRRLIEEQRLIERIGVSRNGRHVKLYAPRAQTSASSSRESS